MLELALFFSLLTIMVYAILFNIYILKYNKKVAEYKELEKVNKNLLIEKYDLRKKLGEG